MAILDEEGRLAKMIAAHDVGRVINPVHLDGQMYGSLHMGIGYALTENFEVEGGQIKAKKMNDCGVLRSHQMPEMELIYIEEGDPECPFGAGAWVKLVSSPPRRPLREHCSNSTVRFDVNFR